MKYEELERIRKEANAVLEYLYEYKSSFAEFIDSGCLRNNINRVKREINIESEGEGVYIRNGAFRMVIIDDELDWVIKMNLADVPGQHVEDGCAREAKLYNYAEQKGLEEYFAACFSGGYFHSMPFTIMQKVCADTYAVISDMDSDLRQSDKEYSEYDVYMYEEDVEVIINVFGNYYSHKQVFELLNFCSDVHMADFHEGNLGYNVYTNKPVILDYACC